jgi:hypothetical protein
MPVSHRHRPTDAKACLRSDRVLQSLGPIGRQGTPELDLRLGAEGRVSVGHGEHFVKARPSGNRGLALPLLDRAKPLSLRSGRCGEPMILFHLQATTGCIAKRHPQGCRAGL